MTTRKRKEDYLPNGQPITSTTADKPMRRSREDFIKEQEKHREQE